MNVPRVVIGVPLYNHADDLPEALESLLNQSYREFRLVCVDDQSTDGTADMVRRYAAQDDRIVYTRNPARLGMIDNWRRVFDLALEYAPEAEYFAWASDHDIWEPGWLATLTEVLDRHPRVVLAYPRNRRIEPDGTLYTRRPWEFDTAGVDDWRVRFKRTMRHMSAGNMVYGLGRVDAIRRAGVFRRVLVPDRLLMMELALEGQFRQVPEVLWFRRVYGHAFSLQRQYRAFFPRGRPLYTYVPWWIGHAAALTWLLGVRAERAPAIGRWAGFRLGGVYLWMAGLMYLRQELTSIRPAGKRRQFSFDLAAWQYDKIHLALWRYYKTKRKAFRKWRPTPVRKWLRRQLYHYRIVFWQSYKTNRAAFRKWRAR